MNYILTLFIPFLGTTLGSAMVFLLKEKLDDKIQKAMLGFASGVMVAASCWSLIIPSIDMSVELGKLAFVPAAVGLLLGFLFLLGLDFLIPHLHVNSEKPEGLQSTNISRTMMLLFAVTLHNIPEGMAVGVIFASFMNGNSLITLASVFALCIGIAIQNIPEGAIVSLPFKTETSSANKAFLYGTATGIVEPIVGVLGVLLAYFIQPLMPWALALAAGCMIYVTIEDLVPTAVSGEGKNHYGIISFIIGFLLMMVLDVLLG